MARANSRQPGNLVLGVAVGLHAISQGLRVNGGALCGFHLGRALQLRLHQGLNLRPQVLLAPGGPGKVAAGLPAPAVSLAGDLAESFTRQATGGFLQMATGVMTFGGILMGTSLCYNRLSALVGRAKAGSEEGGRNAQA